MNNTLHVAKFLSFHITIFIGEIKAIAMSVLFQYHAGLDFTVGMMHDEE